MMPLLDQPEIDLSRPRAASSSFERTLLPKFAEWFVKEVDAYRPDFFVPVETKGARLLEAIDAYAARTLGTPLRIPILYAPALNYLDSDVLAGSRLMLLDDATRTGSTLARHRTRVAKHGGTEVAMRAFVGLATDDQDGEFDEEVRCYLTVGDEVYRDLLWQLSELVVARGLPPEVDHHVFTLALRGQVADNWPLLLEVLSDCGHLSVDGAVTTNADVISMTLHFPTLPETPRYPLDGRVRDEGVKKLRLFADLTNETIHVVPMAFPALDLPAGAADRLPESTCRAVVDEWSLGRATVADLLLDGAQRLDAELLFRVISTTTEVDLVTAFARTLSAALGPRFLALAADRELLRRLHGPMAGDQLGDRIDAEVAATLSRSSPSAHTSAPARAPSTRLLRVDSEVRWATAQIAGHLKWLYSTFGASREYDPMKRVGLSLTELTDRLLPSPLDPLLLSRCIDFGLAMTTLVPFTDVQVREDAAVTVRRKYRVSENNRAEGPYEDMDSVRQELHEEVLALIAHVLGQTCERFRDSGISRTCVEHVAVILQAVVLEDHDVRLQTKTTMSGIQVVLGDEETPESVITVVSRLFTLVGDKVCPSDHFVERYDSDGLRLDRRAGTEAVEAYLTALAPILDSADDVDELLRAWAYSSQPSSGLDVVRSHLDWALKKYLAPVKTLAAGRELEPRLVADAVERGRAFAAAALEALDVLTRGTSSELRATWQPARKAERRLLDALKTPCIPDGLFALARQTAESVLRLGDLVERTSAWASEAEQTDAERAAIAAEIVDACAALEATMTSLSSAPAMPALRGNADDSRALISERLTRVCALLRMRAAAPASRYVAPRRATTPRVPGPARRRTVLVADLAGSTPHSLENAHASSKSWARDGLNLVAQWGRAFGGEEVNERGGDDIFIEFETADRGVLCAAVVQQHVKALRCMGLSGLAWSFRIAVDTGEMSDDENVVHGANLNTAAKLGKFRHDDADATERVLVTPATIELCSPMLRESLSTALDDVFEVTPAFVLGADANRMRFIPWVVAPAPAVRALVSSPTMKPSTIGS